MRFVLALGAAVAVALIAWLRPAAPAAAPPSWSTAPVTQPRSAPPARAVVYVAGAVARPGVYSLPSTSRVADALARAGGARPDADMLAVNLAAHLHDGDEIAVPVRGASPPPRPRRSHGPRRAAQLHGRPPHAPVRHAAAGEPVAVDINRASAGELATLPGIGPALAQRIVAFRAQSGGFDDPEDLLDIAGITEHKLAEIAPYVFVR